VCCFAVSAAAQSPSEADARTARIHLGPLRLTPTIALTNMGVDTNVFNANDASRPQSDFTTTLVPGADAWLRLGRSVVTGSVREDLVYYQQFATERSINGHYNAGVLVPFNRLSLSGGGSFLATRDRPGFEIDARSERTETGAHGGFELRAFGKTFVAATLQRTTVRFDQAAEFMGANLNHELSRVVTSADAIVRYQITPVTSLVLDITRQDDRFLYSNERNSSSSRVMGGVRFTTRLSGSASAGYRVFTPSASDVPAYRGLTANADLSFATIGSTRFGLQLLRDVDYSYDFLQPYYVQTGVSTSFTKELIGPISGTARVGFHQLAYRGRIGVPAPAADRIDVVSVWGGSIGYRLSGGMRVSFNVDRQQRNSDLAGYSYGGLRFGTSVNYGF
jgi:hypothetical protein